MYDFVLSKIELLVLKIPITLNDRLTPFDEVRFKLSLILKFIFSEIPLPITIPFGFDFNKSKFPSTINELILNIKLASSGFTPSAKPDI